MRAPGGRSIFCFKTFSFMAQAVMTKRLFPLLSALFAFAIASGAAAESPTIRVTEEPVVVQPAPFSTRGETVVVPRTRIEIDEGKKSKPKIVSGRPAARDRSVEKEELPPARPAPAAQPAEKTKAPESRAATNPDSGCTSKILCGDPLRRKKSKPAPPEEAAPAGTGGPPGGRGKP